MRKEMCEKYKAMVNVCLFSILGTILLSDILAYGKV